jgi:signal transduction histidine kinase
MPSSLPLALGLASLLAGGSAAYAARLRVRRMRARFETLLEQAARSRSAEEADRAARESARRAFVNLGRRIQAVVNRQLGELREMESRHEADAGVFGDLLHLDHGTALIGRLADSLAVLGGDRPGRRWSKPIAVLGVTRGAMSRITGYRRVDIGPLPEKTALDGEFAEPLIHALAELLDNATRYSPPDARVEVSAYDVPNGLVIEVVDVGVGMGSEAFARAELALATEQAGLELSALGETPRLGLAVVGRLSRATGFEVALERSVDGGVRAIVRVPATLLREITGPNGPGDAGRDPAAAGLAGGSPAENGPAVGDPAQDGADQTPEPARPHSHRATDPADEPPPPLTAHGLPKRHRYSPEAAALPPTRAPSASGKRAGLWLGAFHAGLNGVNSDESGAER